MSTARQASGLGDELVAAGVEAGRHLKDEPSEQLPTRRHEQGEAAVRGVVGGLELRDGGEEVAVVVGGVAAVLQDGADETADVLVLDRDSGGVGAVPDAGRLQQERAGLGQLGRAAGRTVA